MVLYRYVKRPVEIRASRVESKKFNFRIIAVLFVFIGFFFFLNAAYPIISYQLLVSPRFTKPLLSPSSEAEIAQSFGSINSPSVASAKENNGGNEILGSEIDLVDLTKASNWFPENQASFTQGDTSSYSLSIPKLRINDATVMVGMEDLKKSLVQYPGTALPGRYGNTVIFGHSTLPQFFNPRNYATIFATLPTIKPKDEILITYAGVKYKYVVEQMLEVMPNDVSILAQRYDDSYLTLITCVPPGTYLRRLIIRCRLTKI